MNEPRVYIVIVNYLKWEDSKECIESILLSTYRNFSIIVIDNNSGNDSLGKLVSHFKDFLSANRHTWKKEEVGQLIHIATFPGINFLQNDTNTGFARANNLVLQSLREESAYIWLLNPDMVVLENTLEELVKFMKGQPEKCIVGSVVKSYSGNHPLLFYGGGKVNFLAGTIRMIKEIEGIDEVEYISGASLFTHAGIFKLFGLLPDNYFLYWEETDWCYAAKQKGAALNVCVNAVCYDKVSSVIGKGFKSDYYYARNGLLFIKKFRKRNLPVVLCLTLVRYLKRIVTGNFSRAAGIRKGVSDFLKGKDHEAE